MHCSYPFAGIRNMSIQYKQARKALEKGVKDYYNCALEDMTALYRDPLLRRLAIHPALDRLREYDSLKSTDFIISCVYIFSASVTGFLRRRGFLCTKILLCTA